MKKKAKKKQPEKRGRGRPKFDVPRDHHVHVRVSANLYQRLIGEADLTGLPIRALVEAALDRYLP